MLDVAGCAGDTYLSGVQFHQDDQRVFMTYVVRMDAACIFSPRIIYHVR